MKYCRYLDKRTLDPGLNPQVECNCQNSYVRMINLFSTRNLITFLSDHNRV